MASRGIIHPLFLALLMCQVVASSATAGRPAGTQVLRSQTDSESTSLANESTESIMAALADGAHRVGQTISDNGGVFTTSSDFASQADESGPHRDEHHDHDGRRLAQVSSACNSELNALQQTSAYKAHTVAVGAAFTDDVAVCIARGGDCDEFNIAASASLKAVCDGIGGAIVCYRIALESGGKEILIDVDDCMPAECAVDVFAIAEDTETDLRNMLPSSVSVNVKFGCHPFDMRIVAVVIVVLVLACFVQCCCVPIFKRSHQRKMMMTSIPKDAAGNVQLPPAMVQFKAKMRARQEITIYNGPTADGGWFGCFTSDMQAKLTNLSFSFDKKTGLCSSEKNMLDPSTIYKINLTQTFTDRMFHGDRGTLHIYSLDPTDPLTEITLPGAYQVFEKIVDEILGSFEQSVPIYDGPGAGGNPLRRPSFDITSTRCIYKIPGAGCLGDVTYEAISLLTINDMRMVSKCCQGSVLSLFDPAVSGKSALDIKLPGDEGRMVFDQLLEAKNKRKLAAGAAPAAVSGAVLMVPMGAASVIPGVTGIPIAGQV